MFIGALLHPSGTCDFTVWAPFRTSVELQILKPVAQTVRMTKDDRGYWNARVDSVGAGTRYQYRLDGKETRPDPASQWQPDGVHSASGVVDHNTFQWGDRTWRGVEMKDMVQYELHVGTFTPEGTFDAVIPRLEDLARLGITAIELMPLAQFPGERNWGYDGVYPYAVQHSYGGADGLKRLVDACHRHGIAVILDVVYNHLGPEGNYTAAYGPYVTDRYRTPWGRALNFDGPYSDAVRNFFVENALHWVSQFHIDALRLDAVHAIFDMSARHILRELSDEIREFSRREGRTCTLIAESNLNDVRMILPREQGGHAQDAQWLDDMHHCLHTLLTGEADGYYKDFGTIAQFVTCLREGFVYSGQYSAFRKRRHGNSSASIPPVQFVVFSQNHDQIGNRMNGERLSSLTSFEGAKLAAGVEILTPHIPMLFMGEEYAEESPFLYFVSHSDPGLIEAVRKGRREEFEQFDWKGEPPDPQSSATFDASRLRWESRSRGRQETMLAFYTELLALRRRNPVFCRLHRNGMTVDGSESTRVVALTREHEGSRVLVLLNFHAGVSRVDIPVGPGRWKKILDSSDSRWAGPGSVLPDRFDHPEGLQVGGHAIAVFEQGTQ